MDSILAMVKATFGLRRTHEKQNVSGGDRCVFDMLPISSVTSKTIIEKLRTLIAIHGINNSVVRLIMLQFL